MGMWSYQHVLTSFVPGRVAVEMLSKARLDMSSLALQTS